MNELDKGVSEKAWLILYRPNGFMLLMGFLISVPSAVESLGAYTSVSVTHG